MKKLLLFIKSFLLITTVANSALHVVSNMSEQNASFRSIQSAVEYAAPFDTIFVLGSPVNYGNVLLEKPLTLIGEGFTGENLGGYTSKLTRVLLTSNPYRRTISSGSRIIGFEFPYFPGGRPNIVTVSHERSPIENITIERNWLWFLQIVGKADSWQISNNIIRGWIHGGAKPDDDHSGATRFLISNNILNSVKGFARGKDVISNNVIIGRLDNIQAAEIHDNIFTHEGHIFQHVGACIMRNNIAMSNVIFPEECYEPADSFDARSICGEIPNRATNNRIAADPGFLYWPGDDIKGGSAFELAINSAIRKTGTRGKDPGIFDGPYPFPVSAFINREIDDPFPTFVTTIK
jgi:hypothetical protein